MIGRLTTAINAAAERAVVHAAELERFSKATSYCLDNTKACELDHNMVAQALARQAVTVDELQTQVTNIQQGLNISFVLVSGYLVFVMQCGFCMLTAGSVRTKNTKNVLLKVLMDACVGAIAYYITGFAFAFGTSSNSFIGHSDFCLAGTDASLYYLWFFEYTFAATCATIVSGSVAERTSFYAYMAYAFFLTAFVYPVATHWIWSSTGWISVFNPDSFSHGLIDFAGDICVHSIGGWAGLLGAIVVGPRTGRFDSDGNVVPMPGHSASLSTLGTFILWFGWYGFNPGSALAIMYSPTDSTTIFTISRCAVTSTLAPAVAGVTTLFIVKVKDHIFDLIAVLNGTLAGLVVITGSCAVATPYMAVVLGFLSAFVYVGMSVLTLKLRIDDPLDAFPLHGGVGGFGALAVGFVAEPNSMKDAGFDPNHCGVIYGCNGSLLLANFVGLITVIAWTVGLMAPVFLCLKFFGVLRLPLEDELIGNDISKHGGVAYPEDGVETANKVGAKDLADMRDNLGMDDSVKRPAEGEADANQAPVEFSSNV
eukprot:CAMPEP_0184695302 /NCGR_PEP_ID=MMETSP0313-20130426/2982_1 /TAXON_ID=2792 /ORGANISM="Porphyridium aerugineum, Strain SAG 1380-2" /LENGTH=538 /DNA_ID=CAMNT_0027153735 /DNA_START=234 /DNA_END=1850 /DNA_ORIENTATION=+